MALVTSTLTGGSNNHETTSEEANGLYTDILSEGIAGSITNTNGFAPTTGGFAINEQSTPAMAVDVSAGVIYVTGTPSTQNSQNFRIKNDATAAVSISSNVSGSTKYDWIYVELDATNLNTPNAAGDNAASLTVSRSTSSVTDDGTPPTYGYPIAVVTVANGASQIDDEDIRDKRLGVAVNAKQGTLSDGWNAFSDVHSVATGYNAGNRSFTIDTSTDISGIVSEGMRYRVQRGTTPPTQCADLESGSSHYASKSSPSGITFTDTFTVEGWINTESYPGAGGDIVSRYSSTGFLVQLNSSGQLRSVTNGTGGFDEINTYQSVPLSEWVHVAVTVDNNASSYAMYIDGVSVPIDTVTSNTTTITQSGDLTVGGRSGGSNFFDGKLADVRVWSDIRTATEIQDNMFAYPSDTTGLVAHFKLNGDFTDSSSNGNDLTAQNSAVATNTDNPWNATEYGIITAVSASDITVFCPKGYGIPNETLTAPFYSTQDTPFGFPRGEGNWEITVPTAYASTVSSGNEIPGLKVNAPVGEWVASAVVQAAAERTGGSGVNSQVGISTSTSTLTIPELTSYNSGTGSVQPFRNNVNPILPHPVSVTTPTDYYVTVVGTYSTFTLFDASGTRSHITFKSAYI